MRAALHRFVITFAVTTFLLLGGALLLHAQAPQSTSVPETPEERHVGLWLADWRRVPITFPNGGVLSQIIDWSADGERLLVSIFYPDSSATEPSFAFFTPATGKMTSIATGFPPVRGSSPYDPVWDQEHRAIVYLQHRTVLTSTSVFAPVADLVAIDEQGTVIREFTPIVLTQLESVARLVSEGHPEVTGYPTSNHVSVSRSGRVSILQRDRIVTKRLGEADRTILLPVTLTQRLQDGPPSTRGLAGFPAEPQVWVSPNVEYYALAITRTLSIYRVGESKPLHEFTSTCAGELGHNSYAARFDWSPDSQAYYFQFVALENREVVCHTYLQRLEDQELHPIPRRGSLPLIPGGSHQPAGITWQSTGPWIVIDRSYERQCGGQPPWGCVLSQTLLDRYGMQTPIVWWSSRTESEDAILLGGHSAWSPSGRTFATPCTRYMWKSQTRTSTSAICFSDFSWEKPAVDPCQRPLADNLYCGDPDAFLP